MGGKKDYTIDFDCVSLNGTSKSFKDRKENEHGNYTKVTITSEKGSSFLRIVKLLLALIINFVCFSIIFKYFLACWFRYNSVISFIGVFHYFIIPLFICIISFKILVSSCLIHKESLMIIDKVGIQLETHLVLPLPVFPSFFSGYFSAIIVALLRKMEHSTKKFITMDKVVDIVINEAFKGFEVIYYMCIIVDHHGGGKSFQNQNDKVNGDRFQLIIVFPKLLPRRDKLEMVWREAHKLI
ncbi:hypothetical protein PACTADRAFT_2270 [Pachysolen tannophilus NRRL Y-2460]|uniref:Phosphatidylinositol N-acetylglucosaminyltransferase subunit H conserved domain-containing protein n=1 Tax=Pachysolen tannophilus NRRL Y-2460 TaxID=669874 RepID=A0A1E4TW61_PACTA|nr:hypothetical protein PACTADRAFT_2270 [Pachysolen tannophilus NRRL Y-2460]